MPGAKARPFFFRINILGGIHTIKRILNESRTIAESNDNNNTSISTGGWRTVSLWLLDYVSTAIMRLKAVKRTIY